MIKVTCGKCGKEEHQDNEKYCGDCGTRLIYGVLEVNFDAIKEYHRLNNQLDTPLFKVILWAITFGNDFAEGRSNLEEYVQNVEEYKRKKENSNPLSAD